MIASQFLEKSNTMRHNEARRRFTIAMHKQFCRKQTRRQYTNNYCNWSL